MQTLDIISVNLWQILISLCNLLILFLIVKRFLYRPVQNMLKKRQETVDAQYANAKEAETAALADKEAWAEKRRDAEMEAAELVRNAAERANQRGEEILSDAKEKAQRMLSQAKVEAEMEKAKAQGEIKEEIADVSALLAEKLLERELQEEDHRRLIDGFLADMEKESHGEGK